MSDDGNVIDLPVGDARRAHNLRESEFAELPIGSRRGYSLDACKHARSIVDAQLRTVVCSSCGVSLDPIDVLDRIASEFELPLRRVQEARRRLEELQGSISELERVERNAKARVRTARTRALAFDQGAIDATLRVRYSVRQYGVRNFEALSDKDKSAARASIAELIEAYVGALTGAGDA